MKYRIKEKNGSYLPQYKKYGIWITYKKIIGKRTEADISLSGGYSVDVSIYGKVKKETLNKAIKYIIFKEKNITKKDIYTGKQNGELSICKNDQSGALSICDD